MKILIDADACPVKEIAVEEAKKRNIEVIMVCDTSHIINDGYSTTITVDKSADSADLKLINMLSKGDVVISQDYGVAAMSLSKGAYPINQNGLIYSQENIDRLLFERHLSAKVRRSGGKHKNAKKRTKQDDINFQECLILLLDKYMPML